MGLGALVRSAPPGAPGHARTITEFAIIDGVAVDGSGEFGNYYRGAMSVPGAWRASNLVADLLGSVPWEAYGRRPGGTTERIDPTPPLLEQPSPPDTRMTTISSLALDYLYHGNAVEIIAARSPDGWPTATLPIPAQMCGVRRVTETAYSPLPVGMVEYNIGGLTFAPWEVIHTKGPCSPGALKGMGVLEHHMTGGTTGGALTLAREQMRQAQALANHGVPTGFLKDENPDVTTDELREMKSEWMKSQRDRTVAAIGPTTSFQPLSWNPEQLQLVEARRYTLTDLELIFGLPVGWLGGMNSARQYSNIEQDAVNLLKFTLRGPLARFEQTRSNALPPNETARANLDEILRADTLTRYQAYALALTNGIQTVDEIRELENLPPLVGTDDAEAAARALAETLQKIYLSVGKVLTTDEARAIANRAGAGLVIPAPPAASEAVVVNREPSEPADEPTDEPADQPDEDQPDGVRSQSNLDNTPNGQKLWDYWTKGEGLAKWAESPHPYTALTAALAAAGVPAHSVPGLAANIFHAVFGIWPAEREGSNPAGPG